MRGVLAALAVLALLPPSPARADPAGELTATLDAWTDDFNARRVTRICDLFDPGLRYRYRGFPERGHDDICKLLVSSLTSEDTRYRYALDIGEILVSGDLAVVRLTWTLTMQPAAGGAAIASVEPGMDVFRRQPDGSWKIIRYIAYEE